MEKITIKQAIDTRDYLRERVNNKIETINKMKEIHTPKVILDNEEQILKQIKHELFVWELCLDFYRKGYQDCQEENSKNFKLINQELSKKQRLENAIFGETKFVKNEESEKNR